MQQELQEVLAEFRGDLSSVWAKATDEYAFRAMTSCIL